MTMSTKPANEARAEAFRDIGRVIEEKWKLLGGHPMGCSCELCVEVRKWISNHARLASVPHPATPADAGDANWPTPVTDEDESTLLPCPFCYGRAEFHESEDAGGVFIECGTCKASSTMMFPEKCDVRPLLAERWNQRVKPVARRLLDAPPGVGERMREEWTRETCQCEIYETCAQCRKALEFYAAGETYGFSDRGDVPPSMPILKDAGARARAALAAPAPAEPERAKAGVPWQCPKCKRWQSHKRGICMSEFDTGIPCDGKAPAPAASSAAEGSVATGEGGT
jgi:hypothetical protein